MDSSFISVSYWSSKIGTTEPALRLLLTVLYGYPLALLFRKCVFNKAPLSQHLYFITTGLLLGYWNYGSDICHCIYSTIFTYFTLVILKGTLYSVVVTFVFNLGYLLIGYYYWSTVSYDINWTMPHCILTLKLIGVAFDLYDGHQPVESLSADSKKLALVRTPNIFELFGFVFFPAAFLIGPQFSMKRYLEFIGGHYNNGDEPPNSVPATVRKLLFGLFYLAVFQLLGFFVTDDYLISDQFGNLPFYRKMILLGMWGRFTLYKYISCWLLTEGACILFGLSKNGKDERGETRWDGLENVKLHIFENTTEFGHYIKSFNVNTNNWIAQYVYKRLKFLGDRQLSQLFSLLFLAVWHGVHSGYYTCFFFEFVVMYMERDIKSIVNSDVYLKNFFASPKIQLPLQIVLRMYTFVFMGWCVIPLVFLQYPRYFAVFANCNYVGAILFLLWPVVYAPLVRFLLKKYGKRNTEKAQ